MHRTVAASPWLVASSLSLALLAGCVDTGDHAASDVHAVDAQPLAVDLATDLTSFRAGDRVLVELTYTNDSDRPVRLLTWGESAADLLEDDLFAVTVDGARAAYIGPHYKRPAPRDADYVTLAPGDSLTRTADLSDLYDLTRTGSYDIRYADAHATLAATLASNPVALQIAGRARPRRDADLAPRSGPLAYNKCTTGQQSDIVAAVAASSSMANDAATYLAGPASGTPRYTQWFGAFSSNNWNTAKAHYAAIKDALDSKPLTVDCGCKKPYYAYVYPDSPYKIYVCKAFWSAPVSGTDSRGGTLIHELSHFTVVAGTDDHVYGQSGAASLAASNPTDALDNADNHEYFAENTPALN